MLVGWPETGTLGECWLANDHGIYGPPAFEAVQAGGLHSPNDGSIIPRMGGRDVLDPAVPFDPEADAVALIEAQSAMPESYAGAFVQLTTIRRDRTETRIVKWFEDKSELRPSRHEQLFAPRSRP
ncbi:MAG: hypothetical protein PGN33_18760 [Methylobacterium radiotolerans]